MTSRFGEKKLEWSGNEEGLESVIEDISQLKWRVSRSSALDYAARPCKLLIGPGFLG